MRCNCTPSVSLRVVQGEKNLPCGVRTKVNSIVLPVDFNDSDKEVLKTSNQGV